ncbi:MAG TPA: copper transporter [Streptosporangiaceae bacterium]
MIDFRYHLVSIVAVFLALAIGLIVGATAISPKVANQLNRASQAEVRYQKMLYAHNSQLKDQINADNAFAQAAARTLVRGLLQGQRVVLVVAPGADSQTIGGVTSALQQSGAVVTGQVILQPQFFDTGAVTEQALNNAAKSLAPPGVTLPGTAADPQVSGQEAAARVISAAIVNSSGVPTMTVRQSQTVLGGFSQGYLQVSGPHGSSILAGQATMAVVVIPSVVPSYKVTGTFNLALVSFAQDLQKASRGALLAGALTGSGAGSAIDDVASGSAGVTLMTVDNADTPPGQIIVVQALRQLLSPHPSPTSYGIRANAVPSPAPSPLPSPSASPSRSPTKKAGKR